VLFRRNESTGDLAILISEQEIRQLPVLKETEEAIHVENMTLPRADAQVRYFPGGGRAFIYGWTGTYLAESENIARLEKSTVLKNLFDYGTGTRFANIQFYVMMAVLVVIVFLLRG